MLFRSDKVTPLLLLQLGQAMRNFDADTMGSYIFPGVGQLIGKDSVIVPDLEGATAKKILAVFQGRASLIGKVPGASFDSASFDPDAVIIDTLTALVGGPGAAPAVATTVPTPTTTLPALQIENNPRGIVPPDDPSCGF